MSKNKFFWNSLISKYVGLNFDHELVFKPNGTTNLIYKSLSKLDLDNKKILDLGCGAGALGIGLIDLGCEPKDIYFSDLDKNAVKKTKENLQILKSNSVVIESDLFSRWGETKFDIIINDVSGVPSMFSKFFDWFNDVPNESGPDGTHLTKLVIEESIKFLAHDGILITPILSVADSTKSLRYLEKNYKYIDILGEEFFPLSNLNDDKANEIKLEFPFVSLYKMGPLYAFKTTVYMVSN
jgi:hypothetical protein